MAKGTITCICSSCGEEFIVEKKFYKRSDADWWEENAKDSYTICTECYKAEKEAERETIAEKAAEKAAAMGLPPLTGTHKQIIWAEKIRLDFFEEFAEKFEKIKKHSTENQIRFTEHFIEFAKGKVKSEFWIENTVNTEDIIFDEYLGSLLPPIQKKKTTSDSLEPAQNTIIKPETMSEDGIVTIKEDQTMIFIRYPAKNEKLIEIVKSLGYKWDGRWELKKSYKTESSVDRIAEVANKLLLAGFVVDVADDVAREKAIKGDFIPATDRWIYSLSAQDKLGLIWKGRDEALYAAAMKIPSAKYNKGIEVNVSFYKEIEDFAEKYGFKLSPDTVEKINDYKNKLLQSQNVTVAEPAPTENKQA